MVNTAPAMPARPEPSAKVMASTRCVSMPTAPAMARFCVTARTFSPHGVRYSSRYTPVATSAVSPTMKIRVSGSWMPAVGSHAPASHAGSGTLTSCAPKIER